MTNLKERIIEELGKIEGFRKECEELQCRLDKLKKMSELLEDSKKGIYEIIDKHRRNKLGFLREDVEDLKEFLEEEQKKPIEEEGFKEYLDDYLCGITERTEAFKKAFEEEEKDPKKLFDKNRFKEILTIKYLDQLSEISQIQDREEQKCKLNELEKMREFWGVYTALQDIDGIIDKHRRKYQEQQAEDFKKFVEQEYYKDFGVKIDARKHFGNYFQTI